MKTLCFIVLLSTVTIAHAQDCDGMVNAGGTCVPPDVAMPGYQQQQPQIPQSVRGIWVNHYGAIATDPIKGVLGVAVNQTSQSRAEQVAFANCQAKGGTSCKQDIWYLNQCVAMVVGKTGYNTKAGTTINDAVKAAMKVCDTATSQCHAYYTACSLPVLIQ